MEIKYNKKVIKCGDFYESYHYKDTTIKKGFKREGFVRRKHTKKGIQQLKDWLGEEEYQNYKKHHPDLIPDEEKITDKNRERFEKEKAEKIKQKSKTSMRRTKTELRRLINCNPQLDIFLTLTFAKSMPEPKMANPIFNLFTQRMTDHFPY